MIWTDNVQTSSIFMINATVQRQRVQYITSMQNIKPHCVLKKKICINFSHCKKLKKMLFQIYDVRELGTYNILRRLRRPIWGGIGPVNLLLWRSLSFKHSKISQSTWRKIHLLEVPSNPKHYQFSNYGRECFYNCKQQCHQYSLLNKAIFLL